MRILIIEDDERLARVMSRVLQQERFDVDVAYDGESGLEMALNGLPVITAGQTHYRGRGFTLDPASWDEYFAALDRSLAAPAPLTPMQVELAWRYAYHFFYSYPHPFPWRLLQFWRELQTWPLKRVLGAEGQAEFGATFARLAGQTLPVSESYG